MKIFNYTSYSENLDTIRKFGSDRGFTLIELIIYIAIVSGVLTLASGFMWNIIEGNAKATSYKEIQQNLRFAMEKMTRSVRSGEDPAQVFSVLNGILYKNSTPLTADEVVIQELNFESVERCYTMYIDAKRENPENRSVYEAQFDLKGTACFRP